MKRIRFIASLLLLHYCWIFSETYIIPERFAHPGDLTAPRTSSFPYLSCDTYRAFCDFCIDERHIPFDPEKVKEGDTIFLSAYDLKFFFTIIHPKIKRHYILLTHHSDASVPGEFVGYLEDEKLVAWFGQNCDIVYHPKFFPIPIGLANQYWPHGNIHVVNEERGDGLSGNRNVVLYMNFNVGTNRKEREPVWQFFQNKSFCSISGPKSQRGYLQDLKRAQFILSPPGNGLDCHRHWEALLMGAIPIIKHSTLDPLFEGLPVLLIDDWNEITLDFLRLAYERIRSQEFIQEKLFAPYWFNKIEQVKKLAQQKYQH